jgi:hypothetical protein
MVEKGLGRMLRPQKPGPKKKDMAELSIVSRVTDEAPHEKDVEDLFKKAWETKKQWAKKLILTGNSIADDVFRKHAEQNNLSIRIVPLSNLEPIVGPLKELFESDFFKSTT